MRKLSVSIKSGTKTSIRKVVETGRACEEIEEINNSGKIPMTGGISLVFKGDHTVVGGHGDIFERFCETGIISGYPGEGTRMALSSDANYKTAGMRIIQFHETYEGMHYDVDHSK